MRNHILLFILQVKGSESVNDNAFLIDGKMLISISTILLVRDKVVKIQELQSRLLGKSWASHWRRNNTMIIWDLPLCNKVCTTGRVPKYKVRYTIYA